MLAAINPASDPHGKLLHRVPLLLRFTTCNSRHHSPFSTIFKLASPSPSILWITILPLPINLILFFVVSSRNLSPIHKESKVMRRYGECRSLVERSLVGIRRRRTVVKSRFRRREEKDRGNEEEALLITRTRTENFRFGSYMVLKFTTRTDPNPEDPNRAKPKKVSVPIWVQNRRNRKPKKPRTRTEPEPNRPMPRPTKQILLAYLLHNSPNDDRAKTDIFVSIFSLIPLLEDHV